MPPKKRTLAEADPNAATTNRVPKVNKNTTGQRAESSTTSLKPDHSTNSARTTKASSTAGTKKTKSASRANKSSNTSKNTNTESDRGDTMPSAKQATSNAVERAESPLEAPPRIRYGPNGELFVPNALPLEAMNPGMKAKIYPPGCVAIDGIPGRTMTTGNEKWWAENREWLNKHAKALKFNERAWRKKAEDTKAKEKLTAKEKKEGEEADRKILEHEKRRGREDFDWVCMCRPVFDVTDSAGHMHGGDEEEGHPCGKNCHSSELARYHPEHKWVITLRGFDRMAFWVQEMMKRDQDDFDMYIYNDFSGYGILEVIQNQILAFDKAFRGEQGLALWAELEAIAYFLNQDLQPLMMCDDSDGIAALIALIGHAVLNTIALVIEQGEFKPDSKLKNLALVLALFVRFVSKGWESYDPAEEEGQWAGNVVALADKYEINLNVLSSFEEVLDEHRDSNEDREDVVQFGKPTDTGKPWKDVLKEYTKDRAPAGGKGKPKIGGTHFDITKMSAAEKREADIADHDGMI